MRKLLLSLGLLALAAGGLAVALPQAKDAGKAERRPPLAQPINKASDPIVIDGVLEEPAWKDAATVEVKYVWGKVGEAREPWMIARYTWDDQYLYIGYETFDKNLVALGSGEMKGPKGNQREVCVIGHPTEKVDVVEFFLSFGDPHFFWEIHHNAANNFSDIWCNVVDASQPIHQSILFFDGIYFGTSAFMKDDPDAGVRLQTAVKLKPKADGKPSTVNDPSDVDTGYVGELRLPWLGVGAPRASESWRRRQGPQGAARGKWPGSRLRILAVCQNADFKEHLLHSSPTKPGSWFHKGTEHYPSYVLKGPAAKKP